MKMQIVRPPKEKQQISSYFTRRLRMLRLFLTRLRMRLGGVRVWCCDACISIEYELAKHNEINCQCSKSMRPMKISEWHTPWGHREKIKLDSFITR